MAKCWKYKLLIRFCKPYHIPICCVGCKYAKNNKCTRAPKERCADKTKITCSNCKHLMFSDMYGECNKQLKIVNPRDTCEYAEPKERGGEK